MAMLLGQHVHDLHECLNALVPFHSSSTENTNSHSHRRAARRLERCLTTMQQEQDETDNDDELLQTSAATPLLVSVLELTTTAATTFQSQYNPDGATISATNSATNSATSATTDSTPSSSAPSWMLQEIQQAYDASTLMACQLLSRSCVITSEDVDLLLDRLVSLLLLLLQQSHLPSSQAQGDLTATATSLMQLIHTQLHLHQHHRSSPSATPTVILLSAPETTPLLSFLLKTCTDQQRSSSSTATTNRRRPFLRALQGLILDFLKHLMNLHQQEQQEQGTATTATTTASTMRDWWTVLCSNNEPPSAATNPTIDQVWSMLQTLGEECSEDCLDLLEDATTTNTEEQASTLLLQVKTTIELFQILDEHYRVLQLRHATKSLFLGLTLSPHTKIVSTWFPLLMHLARKVLLGGDSTASHDDASLQQAASVLLYMALQQEQQPLDDVDDVDDDFEFLVDYCSRQSKSTTTLSAALMTTLLLPTAHRDTRQQHQLVAAAAATSSSSSPWNYLIARKINLGGETTTNKNANRTVQSFIRQYRLENQPTK